MSLYHHGCSLVRGRLSPIPPGAQEARCAVLAVAVKAELPGMELEPCHDLRAVPVLGLPQGMQLGLGCP